MTPSCQRIATKPGAARVHVRLSLPALLSLLCWSIHCASRNFNNMAGHELRLRGLCRCSLHAMTRLQCLLVHLPCSFMRRVACRFLRRMYSTGPSSSRGARRIIELTIFRWIVSICICRKAVGGHLVSRCCITGRTALSMREYRSLAERCLAVFEQQFPK